MLADRRNVGIVVDEHRQAGPLPEQLADRDVDERQVDRADRNPTLAIHGARDAESCRADLWTRALRLAELAPEPIEKLIGALGGRGALPAVMHLGLGVVGLCCAPLGS